MIHHMKSKDLSCENHMTTRLTHHMVEEVEQQQEGAGDEKHQHDNDEHNTDHHPWVLDILGNVFNLNFFPLANQQAISVCMCVAW